MLSFSGLKLDFSRLHAHTHTHSHTCSTLPPSVGDVHDHEHVTSTLPRLTSATPCSAPSSCSRCLASPAVRCQRTRPPAVACSGSNVTVAAQLRRVMSSALFKPPAPPRKRSRSSAVSVSVSRSPAALFAAANRSAPHAAATATAGATEPAATSHAEHLAVASRAVAMASASYAEQSFERRPQLSASASQSRPLPSLSASTCSAPGRLAAIGCLAVPSSCEWSVREWWVGRRVLIPSFVFPQSRSAALQSLLTGLGTVVLDEWSDGAVQLVVLDEEDAVREMRTHSRHAAQPHNTAALQLTAPAAAAAALTLPLPPPPLPPLSPGPPPAVGAALTLSTTLSHLARAVSASVPIVSLSSLLSSGGSLLASSSTPVFARQPQRSHATITLSSLSGSHASFSRSFEAEGSGLPSHPLLWLTAPKQCSPFIRPRQVRGRQQQPLQPPQQQPQDRQPHTTAADKHRQQAVEAARERERERTGRHTCEVCGVQFSGPVDAHTADATHSRRQREQNWQPLIELAQHLNRRRQAFDTLWSHRQHSASLSSKSADNNEETRETHTKLVSSTSGISSSSGSGSVNSPIRISSAREQHSPSGLCMWYSSLPPPARPFLNWYGDDVVWAAPQHLHRTLQHRSGDRHDDTNQPWETDGQVQHTACGPSRQRVHNPQILTAPAVDGQQSSAARYAHDRPHAPVLQQAESGVNEQPTLGEMEEHGSPLRHQAQHTVRGGFQTPAQQNNPALPASSEHDGWEYSEAALAADAAGPIERGRAKKSRVRAASLGRSMDSQAGRKRQATHRTQRHDHSAARWTSDNGRTPHGAVSEFVDSDDRSSSSSSSRSFSPCEATVNTLPSGGPTAFEAHTRPARLPVNSNNSEFTGMAAGHTTLTGGAVCDTTTIEFVAEAALQKARTAPGTAASAILPRRHPCRLERELMRLAVYDRRWLVVKQGESSARTRGGRFEACAVSDSSTADTPADGGSLLASSHTRRFDEARGRLTRSSLRQRGSCGDELLQDAAGLDGADLTRCMHFQSMQANKQRAAAVVL